MSVTPAAEIRFRVRDFLRENFLYTQPDLELPDDENLLDAGIIDSMGIAELVTFLEDAFGVDVRDDDISEANLGSVTAIVGFVVHRGALTATP